MTRTIARCVLAVMIVPCMLGCDSLTGASNIEYRVSGTAELVSLTYQTEAGGAQISSRALPWSFSHRATRGDFLYVSAQIIEGDGSVTAAIYTNGDLFGACTDRRLNGRPSMRSTPNLPMQ